MSPRIILLPGAFIFEAFLMLVVFVLSYPYPLKALALVEWVIKTLPEIDWYLGKDRVK